MTYTHFCQHGIAFWTTLALLLLELHLGLYLIEVSVFFFCNILMCLFLMLLKEVYVEAWKSLGL
jgi:hypothetical protein